MAAKETLSFDRVTKPASDHEVERAAAEVLAILRSFESPKDAGSALTLAHFRLLLAAFPPEFRSAAIDAVDGHCGVIKELLNEGWH